LEDVQYAIYLIEFGLMPAQVNELPLRLLELLSPIRAILRGGDKPGA
jgi:hypothetical protein